MQRYLMLVALLVGTATASAQQREPLPELSYNYLQAGYQRISLDVGDDGNGAAIGGALEFGENLYGFVSYGTASFDFGIDLNSLSIGAGYHTPISRSTDAFVTLAYVDADASADGFQSIGDNGFGATLGVRGMLNPRLELTASASYVDLGNGNDGTSLGGAGWYLFRRHLAVGFFADFDDDGESYGVGLRWYFDR